MITTAQEVHGNGRSASKWLRLAVCAAAFLTTVGFATSASAWSYTLVDPITIDGTNNGGSGVFGTINLVTGHFLNPTPTGGDTAGVVLDNSIDKTLQDFVWFSVTLAGGSAAIDRIQVAMGPPQPGGVPNFGAETYSGLSFTLPPVGAGFYDPGSTVSPNGGTPVAIDTLFGGFSQYNWDFGAVSTNNLEGGDTSADLLWVGELLVSGGQGVIFNNVVGFMIQVAGTGQNFTVQGVVPEPSTALLVGGGLIGMSVKRRREFRAAKVKAKAAKA